MSYFALPAFLQKRVLRYALVQLDLFDTDALDLDQLDIVWGSRSTIELRNIDLRVQRISSLLKLPSSVSVKQARVLSLQLSVPADIHRSSISVAVQGVRLQLSIDAGPPSHLSSDDRVPDSHGEPGIPKGTRANRPREGSPKVHDPGGERFTAVHPWQTSHAIGDGGETALPNAASLAASFLDAEPATSKAELLSALAQSRDVAPASIDTTNEPDTDDRGFGAGLNLPGFLTEFIQGVVNRLRINISDVQATLRVLTPVTEKATTSQDVQESVIRLLLEECSLENAASTSPSLPSHWRLAFRNLCVYLIADSSLNEEAHSTKAQDSIRANSPSHSKRPDGTAPEGAVLSKVPHRPNRLAHSAGPGSSRTEPPAFPQISEDAEPVSSRTDSLGTAPEATNAVSSQSNRLPNPRRAFSEAHGEPTSPAPSTSYPLLSNDVLPSHPQLSMRRQGINRSLQLRPGMSVASSESSPRSFIGPATHESSPLEDLSQSKLFSHEEAASMYMSATSEAAGASVARAIPGQWTADDTESASSAKELTGQDWTSEYAASSPVEVYGPANSKIEVLDPDAFMDSQLEDPPTPRPEEAPREMSSAQAEQQSDQIQSLVLDANSDSQPVSNALSRGPESSAVMSSPAVAKKAFQVDHGHIDIPLTIDAYSTATSEIGAHLAKNETASKLPGSFDDEASILDEARHPITKCTADVTESAVLGKTRQAEINMVVHGVKLFFDMALLRHAASMLAHKSISRMGTTTTTNSDLPSTTAGPRSNQNLRLKVASTALCFMRSVPTVFEDQITAVPALASQEADDELLLELTVQDISGSLSDAKTQKSLNICLGRISLHSANDQIITFDAASRLRDSVRDRLEPQGRDVEIEVTSRPSKGLETTVMTLPLRLKLDLVQLDELINELGGLSSILDVASSIMPPAPATEPLKASKGVRFEDTPVNPRPSLPHAPSKFTARVGGLHLEVCNKVCGLLLEGTAVKIIGRESALAMRIDKLRLHGPLVDTNLSTTTAPLAIIIDDCRIEYLSTAKEDDVARLLALLSPSRDRQDPDDDILLDTLIRQRRQGSVVRLTVSNVQTRIDRLEELESLIAFAEDFKKISTVAKYLPEDDRPGLLALLRIEGIAVDLQLGHELHSTKIELDNLEIGLVTFPLLFVLGTDTLTLMLGQTRLIGEALPRSSFQEAANVPDQLPPSLMIRWIGDELIPTVKLKLWNFAVEYHTSIVAEFLVTQTAATSPELVRQMSSSLASLTELRGTSDRSWSSGAKTSWWPQRFEASVRDSMIGLNPKSQTGKGLFMLSDVQTSTTWPKNPSKDALTTTIDIRKAHVLLIDDTKRIKQPEKHSVSFRSRDASFGLFRSFSSLGFVRMAEISSAAIHLKSKNGSQTTPSSLDVEVRNDLFVLESCADSTKTLGEVLQGLALPSAPSQQLKYRTEIVPVEDMLASFTGEPFEAANVEEQMSGSQATEDFYEDPGVEDDPINLDYVADFFAPHPAEMLSASVSGGSHQDLKTEAKDSTVHEPLEFDEMHFANEFSAEGEAYRWNSEKNAYDGLVRAKVRDSPFRLKLRDVHFIWNLFDGYDWQNTRDTISQAVASVETRAAEKLAAERDRRRSREPEEDEESVIGDFLFNSIYIGIPANQDPRELARKVNRNLDDLASEAESYATMTTLTPSPNRQGPTRSRRSRLRLQRSKHHKMTFELKGISADAFVFPPDSGETQSSVDVRVRDFEIYDHVPTSTWRKFATYMHDAGERESGASMLHIELLNVQPVPELAALEMILKVTVSPLRLHVDQDALDFLTRFFEFKDESKPPVASESEAPFLQRVEINSVPIKLDFKPKRVDYAGLRSGHTTEFMNFFILDAADMVLRHVIIYGVSGFDKLGKTLNDIWMPDIRRNQLPGVLAGLAPVRSLVNVGAGVKDLVVVPMREYRKDGRVLRSIRKGAFAFAKTTTTELAKLGAKLAIGTQTVLQNAEDLVVPTHANSAIDNDLPLSPESPVEERTISPYADQPVGVAQGLRGAYRHLERDLLLARDAIVAMPGEVLESATAGEAARAVLRGAPTVILRPALGVSKAVSQTLLGATNALDKDERRRIEDKYKRI